MPNRIIRSDINRSERVNQLDAAEEVFYRRLLNEVDDHGLFDARLSILRATLFPLRLDRVREADISRWMAACQKAGLIVLYEAGGKPYLKVLNTRWKARSEPKYPLPGAGNGKPPSPSDNSCNQLQATADNCAQLETIAPLDVDVFVGGDVVDACSNGGDKTTLENSPFDNFDDPLADMALAVAKSIGKPSVPEGADGALIHAAAAEFVDAGCKPADVGDYETDYYQRKAKYGSRYPLTVKILREDLPGWVRGRSQRARVANGASGTPEPPRSPVVAAPASYRQPRQKGGI